MSFLRNLLFAALVIVAAAGGALYYWAKQPLTFATSPLDVTIHPHSSTRSVSEQLEAGGVPINHWLFELLARGLRMTTALKSGNYEFENGVTPYDVLLKIARGDVNQFAVTIVEGWTFAHMRAELNNSPQLEHDSASMSDADLLKAIGAPETQAEGLFFPDTYLFDKGTSDLSVFKRAYREARDRLTQAWAARAPDLAFQTPYEALVMASLVEKETGVQADRGLVSAVFSNRLKKGMPLQTDPSVIYGLGAAYDGHLHKHDLLTDTPFNTYLHPGLPPTPIALPGMASLLAAVNPAQSNALYFVSRGDGHSEFSENLGEHNRAVDKYIRGKP
ncbi:endolytic transglycosylase MltG [Pararobbsia silviterrae]|uniref:Endolytic murein transglycosylase n=1 Tax=Pararobbsia silviterrae TaxID=1792498 RepID=A0A494X7F8_9BURK|nr:endolytic transglycosylase MltG [Pararobbsia silviterrae]RKP44236.1 endolytic transglycosylase MltG [Pararobbsia silviterrae]